MLHWYRHKLPLLSKHQPRGKQVLSSQGELKERNKLRLQNQQGVEVILQQEQEQQTLVMAEKQVSQEEQTVVQVL